MLTDDSNPPPRLDLAGLTPGQQVRQPHDLGADYYRSQQYEERRSYHSERRAERQQRQRHEYACQDYHRTDDRDPTGATGL